MQTDWGGETIHKLSSKGSCYPCPPLGEGQSEEVGNYWRHLVEAKATLWSSGVGWHHGKMQQLPETPPRAEGDQGNTLASLFPLTFL
jgi:hypothetical protein